MIGKLPKITIKGAEQACTQLHDAIVALGRFEGSGEVQVRDSGSGRSIELARNRKPYVQLAGTANPYTGTEVYPFMNGGWNAYPGAENFVEIYEDNAQTALGGKFVQIERGYGNGWRFEYVRVPSSGTISATICVSTYNCDSSSKLGTIVTITGPSGFSMTCTTVGNAFANQCCVMATHTGTYTATTCGQSHTVNVTTSGTYHIANFCCDGAGGTNYTACVTVKDCSGLVRSGVVVNFPGVIVNTDATGQACACITGAGGTVTINSPETGYSNLVFTAPTGTPCSNANLGLKTLGLSAGYSCPDCVQGGTGPSSLRTPYQRPQSLTDSLCGGGTLTGANTWVNTPGPSCNQRVYTLSCFGIATIMMDVHDIASGLHASATQGTWIQNPFAATFTMPISVLYPAGATISVSFP